jgi:hypothetical protein
MLPYRVVALASSTAEEVRASLRSPGYGHPATVQLATGHGPCRHCLRAFRVGEEERILFTYDAFEGVERLPLPGPVFVHAAACERYPEEGGFPADLVGRSLTLNGYARGRRLAAQEYVSGEGVAAAVERLLDRPGIDYIHVRDTEAGCYDFRIERG